LRISEFLAPDQEALGRLIRGPMARWLEDAGATFDATVFAAARADA